jgi:hypothetical protein
MKPILFNTEMAKAILDGKKTQTRRIIKPQPKCYGPNLAHSHEPELTDVFLSAEKGILRCRRCGHYPIYSAENSVIAHYWKPPYQEGDILYAREIWQESECFDYNTKNKFVYKADQASEEFANEHNIKWHPSIHMPKEAARIFLKVTNVKVERLQDISEEDAKAEGVGTLFIDEIAYSDNPRWNTPMEHKTLNIEQFELLWDSCYGKSDTNKWDANPWVWIIEFERTEEQI